MRQKIVAIIHARGGSKRLPLKNLRVLLGRPLIEYPVKLGKAIPLINRVIVSSDHPEIIRLAKEAGAEAPFVRPSDISEDVPSELVNLHAVKWLIDNENYKPDILITLTPSTPLTKASDVEGGIRMLLEHPDWDSVVTVRKAHEFPAWMIDVREDGLGETLLGNSFDGEFNVSQNLKRYFYPMGAFYINRVDSFLKKPSCYGNRYGCIEIDPAEQVDIDTVEDLIEAERIARRSCNIQ